jgi:predicted dehydrogenase
VLLREFLKQGWLGEPFEVGGAISKEIGPEKRRQLACHSGGTMFDLGCHLIDLIVALLGKPKNVYAYPLHSSPLDDKLLDNMLAVVTYPRATATVKSSALEVEGFDRRHLVVCGSEGTFHIQPLDDPAARVALSTARGKYRKGYQDVRFPKYERYGADAADMARIIRGEKKPDFSYDHDMVVQQTVLKACGMSSG